MQLIPSLQFAAPLPALELARREAKAENQGKTKASHRSTPKAAHG